VMAHYLLASARLVDSVREAGGFVYVWTVDDASRIRALEDIGVDGVITNDPRLFQPAAA
jgi:glycerophosphoryl diester phosphodiesterase